MHFPSHLSGIIFLVHGGSPREDAGVLQQNQVDLPDAHKVLDSVNPAGTETDFRSFFALILLLQSSSRVPPPLLNNIGNIITSTRVTTEASVGRVCEVFEKQMLFQGPENDQWHRGQAVFREKVRYFVEARIKIRFCLPAFPCKSSNPDKVGSRWPDGAEFEALSQIFQFCLAVQGVYPPGCVIDVVSDGHVFSDCVGTDDEVVSEYTRRLHVMAEQIRSDLARTLRRNLDECITFQGLRELLQPLPWVGDLFRPSFARLHDSQHPVHTVRTLQDNVNRDLLLHGCSACHSRLQQVVHEDPGHALTMLYRGFSRFMLDDLQAHPDGQGKSKSQRKKLAEKVAVEMMRRNQAYSHFVELVMPRHVRLSIHAHDNSGPKFAISLLPRHKFRPLTSFDGLRLSTKDHQYGERHHLHIPTPWHNAIVEVDGDKTAYICKSGLVKAELGMKNSVWSPESGYVESHRRGGRFVLFRRQKSGAVLSPDWPVADGIVSV